MFKIKSFTPQVAKGLKNCSLCVSFIELVKANFELQDICSKCRTLKTSSRTVLIQAQLNPTLPSMLNRKQSRQLSMSIGTQACNQLMPTQWAGSRQLSMSTKRQACNLSMPTQWA